MQDLHHWRTHSLEARLPHISHLEARLPYSCTNTAVLVLTGGETAVLMLLGGVRTKGLATPGTSCKTGH